MARVCSILFLLAFFISQPAFAQTVNVRAGEHDTYSRIVFDWPSKVEYKAGKQNETSLLVSFNSTAMLNLSDAQSVKLSNISGIQILAASGREVEVLLTVPEGSTFRHFYAGNRVVVDVFDPPGGKQEPKQVKTKQVPPVKPEPKQGTKEESVKVVEAEPPSIEKEDLPEPEKKVPEKEESQRAETKPSPRKGVKRQPLKPLLPQIAIEPHMITVSSTETYGVAVFERNGYLWIVLDKPDIPVLPQLKGPQKIRFDEFERMPMQGGTAFRTKLPAETNIYGEGGGLLWNVLVTQKKRRTEPVEAVRRAPARKDIRGSSLFLEMQSARQVLDLPDPETGDVLKVLTVSTSADFAGPMQDFVDLRILHSPIGMAVETKVDDLEVKPEPPGVVITRPDGLAVSHQSVVVTSRMEKNDQEPLEEDTEDSAEESLRIYNFRQWQMGGPNALRDNQRILLAGLIHRDGTGRVQDLLTLAKLNISNGWGNEALGFLRFAAQIMPEIGETPEYLALRGAARALAHESELALSDLSASALEEYEEIKFWRSYVLADLEDWRQAAEILPDNFNDLGGYPAQIRSDLALVLAEIALRSGDVEKAERLLEFVFRSFDRLKPHQKNAWNYLTGETYRQKGEEEKALEIWRKQAEGFDELYRAKGGLAHTNLKIKRGELETEEAIDDLERLRYVWRGDELETWINFRLGEIYLDNEEFLKGLSILRDAASLSPETDLGQRITTFMSKTFRDLFLSPDARPLTPLEAVTLYEEFPELTPAGEEGDRLVERLAETLVQADLLGRAAKLLQHQFDHRLKGEEAARVGIRLSAIYLLDDKPLKAMDILDRTQEYLAAMPADARAQKDREAKLLRARALSETDHPGKALNILHSLTPDSDINRLKADIAWQSGQWDDAAEALENMILDAGISPARKLTQDQADLILNHAVALNLADNRMALANLRDRYMKAMRQTPRARLFEVVTRPRQLAVLADRETLSALVSEVDMFRDFLDAYREAEE